MLSRRRITVALIALILLAIGGWFIQNMLTVDDSDSEPGSLPDAEPGVQFALQSSPPSELSWTWTLTERGEPSPQEGAG